MGSHQQPATWQHPWPATISFYSLDALEPNAAFVSWPSSHVEDYTQTGLSQSRTHDQVIQVLELVLNQRHRHGIELPKISLLNCLKCAFVVNIMQYLTSGPFSKIPLTIHRERMLYATAQRDKSYDINVSRIRRAPMSWSLLRGVITVIMSFLAINFNMLNNLPSLLPTVPTTYTTGSIVEASDSLGR